MAESEADRLGAHPADVVYRVEYEDAAVAVPEELRSMPAKDRAVWLVVQRVHDAALSDEDPRTPTPFAELSVEAQAALITTLTPVIQIVNAVARNPEAKRS